ncbi:MAG: efflux RND transporter periplasmic adaptor subunit [Flavisolibacter sp.]
MVWFGSCKSNKSVEEGRVPYQIPDSLFNTLKIDTVKSSRLTNALKFNGVVDFNTEKVVNIYPLITGNITDIKVMPGDYVKKGQELGKVKSAEIANFNAALLNAEASIKITSKLLEQQKSLYNSGLASQVDITTAEVNYQQALAAKTAAEKVLSINGNNRNGEYIIKSPIDGFIVAKNINNGTAIRNDNSSGLFTISDLKDVWIQANVYEENIGKVHEGDSVDVTTISYPDKIFKGKINKLTNVLDPSTKVMKMRVILSNPGYILKPQMFATVIVNNTGKENAISISSDALIFDHSQYYVLLYKSRKDVQIRPVELISLNGKTAFIKNGITPGDLLIATQALLIYNSLNN